MADSTDNHPTNQNPDVNLAALDGSVEEEPLEVETPRRAASAQFVVDSELNAEAALREAMDPANQSLADALRVSYKILRIAMIILVVLFLVSGFQTVAENETGVKLRFGKIVGSDTGYEELVPGPQLGLPYPAGEYLIFNDSATVNASFLPQFNAPTMDQAVQAASVNDPLRAGQDHYLLTADDSIVHLQLQSTYTIDDAIEYLRALKPDQAGKIVNLALRRATIHTTSSMTVDQILASREQVASRIRSEANSFLAEIDSGIELQRVQVVESKPPFAIVQTFEALQTAVAQSGQRRSQGRQARDQALNEAVGENYPELLDLMDAYAEAVVGVSDSPDDPALQAEAEARLDAINDFLLSEKAGGRVGEIINGAIAHRHRIAGIFNSDARRFEALHEQYQRNPTVVVQNLLARTHEEIFSGPGVEQFYIPPNAQGYNIHVTSLYDAMLARREARMERRREQARQDTGLDRQFMERFGDEQRQLTITEEGEVTGRQNN